MDETLSFMAQKITHWLITALVLSLGFGQLLRFSYAGTAFYLHDFIVGLILLLNLRGTKDLFKIAGLKLFFWGLVISSIFALATYSFSSLLLPSLYLIRIVCYLFLFSVYKNSKLSLPITIFYISGITTLIIGIIQYFFMPDMRWAAYLGWDDHLSRLVLPHFDPTFTAVMASIFLLSITRKVTLQNLMIVPLTLLTILLSYSRSVWIAIIATSIYFVKNKLALFLIIATLMLGVIMLPKKFGEGTNLLRSFSISARFNSDKEYLSKYGANSITGRGMNTLGLDRTSGKYEDHASGPNNSYLYLLLTTGIIGFIGWTKFLTYLYQNSVHKEMLVFFFIASIFNNVMFYPFALLWVLLLEAKVPSAT